MVNTRGDAEEGPTVNRKASLVCDISKSLPALPASAAC
ncbi:hypothetical protein D777_00303 [Marinobacter nitratireducens]|uniref:Uncharacterized protein n=1 Tax=Marinobacter nitratireducens TaxID=1137280 RepID=A0A072MYL0_9GAMM|nr:hypothetical protein D777_00303 [Marinobacter nitratireducens]